MTTKQAMIYFIFSMHILYYLFETSQSHIVLFVSRGSDGLCARDGSLVASVVEGATGRLN